jgi:hypothetical protein
MYIDIHVLQNRSDFIMKRRKTRITVGNIDDRIVPMKRRRTTTAEAGFAKFWTVTMATPEERVGRGDKWREETGVAKGAIWRWGKRYWRMGVGVVNFTPNFAG